MSYPCGCTLETGTITWRFCPLHAAASDMLVLLERALPYLRVVSRNDLNAYSENDPHLYEEAGAVIAKARQRDKSQGGS